MRAELLPRQHANQHQDKNSEDAGSKNETQMSRAQSQCTKLDTWLYENVEGAFLKCPERPARRYSHKCQGPILGKSRYDALVELSPS